VCEGIFFFSNMVKKKISFINIFFLLFPNHNILKVYALTRHLIPFHWLKCNKKVKNGGHTLSKIHINKHPHHGFGLMLGGSPFWLLLILRRDTHNNYSRGIVAHQPWEWYFDYCFRTRPPWWYWYWRYPTEPQRSPLFDLFFVAQQATKKDQKWSNLQIWATMIQIKKTPKTWGAEYGVKSQEVGSSGLFSLRK